jgi:hypothetical protein
VTAHYKKADLSFEYPENWELDEEVQPPELLEVTVYSPSGAFWSVHFKRPAVDPGQMTENALAAMREEYVGLEAEPVTEVIENAEFIGIDMSFFYLDLPNTAQVRSLRTSKGTYTILCQAEDDDFERLEAVFRAMTVSLLRSQA